MNLFLILISIIISFVDNIMKNSNRSGGFNMDANLKITKELDCDVLVVGAGNAGMQAAAAAAEAGSKTILIEKEENENMLRLSVAAVGSKSQKRAGNYIDKHDLVNYMTAFAQGRVDQKLIYTWANHSAETVDWTEEQVLKPNGLSWRSEPDAFNRNLRYQAWPTQNDPELDNNKGKLSPYTPFFIEKLKDLGVDIHFKLAMKSINKESGKVTGIIAYDLENEIYLKINAKKGTILCTGGYSANTELLEKWNPLSLKKNVTNDSPRANGDGIVEAIKVGGWKDEEPAQLVFDRGMYKPGEEATKVYKESEEFGDWLWLGSQPFLKVNKNGERFANESSPYEYILNAAAYEPDYAYAMIFDANYGDDALENHMVGCARIGFPGYMLSKEALIENTEKYIDKGFVQVADSLEELAEKLQMPKDKLIQTVERYNECCEKGIDEDFGKEKMRLHPVKQGPYYGVYLAGRNLCTLDGLRINTNMQVIDKNYDPIPGLYAAGNDSGGFFCGSYSERLPGLAASRAQTFGRLAGKHAAQQD